MHCNIPYLFLVWLLQIPLIILPLSQLKPLLRTKLCERLALRIGCCYISFAPGASLTYNMNYVFHAVCCNIFNQYMLRKVNLSEIEFVWKYWRPHLSNGDGQPMTYRSTIQKLYNSWLWQYFIFNDELKGIYSISSV